MALTESSSHIVSVVFGEKSDRSWSALAARRGETTLRGVPGLSASRSQFP